MSGTEQRILARLALGATTLAGLRAALPPEDLDRTALPTMGEPDPFGEILTDLVNRGVVLDGNGLYRLA
ncbi:hypothetical protein [uncultured Amnibacterium sp.]|uniref:hypothetical protein n=1 Tax=uncultured Amnibacterium sp. TaxID=1631851 RepID=UPI0035CA790D